MIFYQEARIADESLFIIQYFSIIMVKKDQKKIWWPVIHHTYFSFFQYEPSHWTIALLRIDDIHMSIYVCVRIWNVRNNIQKLRKLRSTFRKIYSKIEIPFWILINSIRKILRILQNFHGLCFFDRFVFWRLFMIPFQLLRIYCDQIQIIAVRSFVFIIFHLYWG